MNGPLFGLCDEVFRNSGAKVPLVTASSSEYQGLVLPVLTQPFLASVYWASVFPLPTASKFHLMP